MTLTGWAKALALDPKTVAQRLRKAGYSAHAGDRYSVREVVLAVYGDMEKARLEHLAHENALLAVERKQKEGDYVSMAAVAKLITETVTHPLRSRLLSLPTEMSVRVNPHDPTLAQTALTEWVDETLKMLREKLKP